MKVINHKFKIREIHKKSLQDFIYLMSAYVENKTHYVPQTNSYVEVLTPTTSEYDHLEIWSLWK